MTKPEYELSASRVAVGHCVIINEIDAPQALCVAVVVRVAGNTVSARYLAEKAHVKLCFTINRQNVTPVNAFGFRVIASSGGSPIRHEFRCVSDLELAHMATYPDDKPRAWQEYTGPVIQVAKLKPFRAARRVERFSVRFD